jgi:hypothetical protein
MPGMKRAFALALLIATSAPAATLPSPNWPAPADRGENLLRQTVLNAQNQARGRFGVPALAWSDDLAAQALSHAQFMASTGQYTHDQTPGRRKTAGENLWRGQRGLFSYDVMIGVMIAEAQHFRAGVFPNNSRTGQWNDVAHYTQIVWPTTTSVGCALAASATTDYFVCRYSPTGNKDGFELAERRD